MQIIENIWISFIVFLGVYFFLGFLFGLYFVFAGVSKIDSSVKDSTIGFRLIILPGSIALWPFLVKKLIDSKSSNL